MSRNNNRKEVGPPLGCIERDTDYIKNVKMGGYGFFIMIQKQNLKLMLDSTSKTR